MAKSPPGAGMQRVGGRSETKPTTEAIEAIEGGAVVGNYSYSQESAEGCVNPDSLQRSLSIQCYDDHLHEILSAFPAPLIDVVIAITPDLFTFASQDRLNLLKVHALAETFRVL
jgi:hypothetical protein